YNPSYVLDKKQAEFAAVLALKAFENGQNIANKLAIEFLVRLSGEKQIKKALAFGMEGLGEIAGIVLLDDEVPDNIQEIPFTPDINMISRKYGVKKKDIEKGIYEKMALVDI
ncbi:MAG TPA: KEOPS complex subunit Cgi121, partial [Candidatus Methanofastidiosa archaeon]|nr:KEOPS complex subunit Cgi121 [Candidatus Methanofastidiosa archaeon]